MATSTDEYNSLRQEILNHQNNRLTVLGLALTATAALVAAGIQLKNPLPPLMAAFLISAARIQLVEIYAGIQRISSYIRVILEDGNPELNWESGSYFARRSSIKVGMSVRNISSLTPTDNLLFFTGLASNVIAGYLAWLYLLQQNSVLFGVIVVLAVFWLVAWFYYYFTRVCEWNNMNAEDREAQKWIEFRKTLSTKTAREKRTTQRSWSK
jgi:hypothetical protein